MEFEPHLIEYLRSTYINFSLCAQKCIRPFTVDEKPSPALKNPSVWRRYVLWDDVLWEDGLRSHGKLWFWISGWEEKRAECYWGKQMMWTERYADNPDCPWDQRMSFLQTHSAFGSCHWNFWRTDPEGSCVHFGGGFGLRRDSDGLQGRLRGAGLVLPTGGGELDVVVARDWSYWEPWTAAEKKAGGVGESGLAAPWICRNKKGSESWSVWTNPSYPRPCQDRGWEFTALTQAMGWSQDRPLVSDCSSVIVIHCTAVRENEVSFPFEQY